MTRAFPPAACGARAGRAPRAIALLAAGVTLALLASCAPHRLAPPPFSAAAREAAFRQALARREALGRAVDAEVTLWARRGRSGPWRGVTGVLSLQAPDACRLRVASMFGTAIDVAARGDSLVALLPARHLGVVADAARDVPALRRTGSIGVRALGALWRPPDGAWEAGTWSDGSLTLRWAEAGDSLRLVIGPDGLPKSVTLARGDSVEVRLSYGRWMRREGVAWPSAIELGDRDGALGVRFRLERARFRPEPDAARLAVRLPAGTDSLDWPGFRRALEGLEELR